MVIVRPVSAVVYWARSGQPWDWAPKVAGSPSRATGSAARGIGRRLHRADPLPVVHSLLVAPQLRIFQGEDQPRASRGIAVTNPLF
jgi:hypothetical protein